MRFSIFGIPTFVNWGFWLAGLFLGMGYLSSDYKVLFLVWMAVIFVSILIHELGHAVACIRYGLQPAIELNMMGGVCSYDANARLSRKQQMIISFAGPLAGFIFAGLIWGVLQAFPGLMRPWVPGVVEPSDVVRIHSFKMLLGVNTVWGLVNLLPVLPLDGGHILAHALGPRRSKTAAKVSLATGAGVALICFASADWIAINLGIDAGYTGILFGFLAFNNYMRYRQEHDSSASSRASSFTPAPTISNELQAQLIQLKKALDEENFEVLDKLAEAIASTDAPAAARIEALEAKAWGQLLQENVSAARTSLKRIESLGHADTALLGAIFFASGELRAARNIFEAARAAGDDRKEIVGPLIQILIGEGEVARAAAIALDIVDTLSEDDARQMAALASEHDCHAWASRLHEAMFERSGDAEDAFKASRSRVLAGDLSAAEALLEHAQNAGLGDIAERIQNDEAFAALVAEHPDLSAFGEGHAEPASIPSEPAPLADDQEEKE